MAAAISASLNTNDTIAMIKKLELVAAEAQLKADRLKRELELNQVSYPVDLTDAMGELATKAQVITTAELRKILVPYREWSVCFRSAYNQQPGMMPSSFVRTIDGYGCPGFLVRCAPVNQYDLAHSKVAGVFQRYSDVSLCWVAQGSIDNTKEGQFIGAKESQRFAALASGKEVEDHSGKKWKII